MPDDPAPQICDYEGSTYRTDFWEGRGREYEDQVERGALQRLMPLAGDRLVEIGAGYGRLFPLYRGYRQVVLFDYSRSQLEFAREQFGDSGVIYVAGDVYRIPFAPGLFDTAVMVRVLHHMQDPPAALRAVRSIVHRDSTFVLEFANKQNLKAIARWALRRQTWSPFALEPVEFVALNYDFHPRYVLNMLHTAGFAPGTMRTVSHFRLELIKRVVPTGVLVWLDSLAQLTGNLWQLSPSVFVRSQATGADQAAGADEAAPDGAFWRCPSCQSLDMDETEQGVTCKSCGAVWPRRNGIYDFKEPSAP
jgi:SAM-dependent methyltransferase